MTKSTLIRQATADDKRELFDLMWYCFKEPMVNCEHEEHLFKPAEFLLAQDINKTITASIKVCPYDMFYGASIVPIGGIALVSSRPDYRYSGNMGALINATIESMYNSGIVFSPLAPFDYKFYRNYGWEITYDRQFYTLDVDTLKGLGNQGYTYKLLSLEEYLEMLTLNNQYFKQYAGALKLKHKDMVDQSRFFKLNGYDLVAVKDGDSTIGYMVYKIQNRIMTVREFVSLTSATDRALLNYIYYHNAQIGDAKITLPLEHTLRFHLDEPRFPIEFASDMMTRVVDVKKAMELNCYDASISTELIFDIDDPHGPWNHGKWLMKFNNGHCTATKLSESDTSMDSQIPTLQLTIQTLAQMLLGYHSMTDLHHLGKVTALSPQLSVLFPKKVTFMNERI